MTPTEFELRQFLLRRLPPPAVERMEEALFGEEGVAERLRGEEFDLLQDYAEGKLAAADRADVERYVLNSTESRHSLRVGRLIARAGKARVGHGRWRPIASVGGLLAAGLAALVLIPQWAGGAVGTHDR